MFVPILGLLSLGSKLVKILYTSPKNKHKLLILSCLNDFMTCSERFNTSIQSEGSISQLWNNVGR